MPKLGLVLSGGSILGVAHIGMLQALERHRLLDEVRVVVGTSAGSIVGAMFAFGYSPEQIWQIWYKDVWRLFGGKRRPGAVEDWNVSGFFDALLHLDYKRFRGALHGNKLLKALECYLTDHSPCTSIRPIRKRLPFYAVSTDFNTAQETVWRFTKHIRPTDIPPEVVRQELEPAPGRRASWQIYSDEDPEIQHFPSMAQVCRCSASIPFVFVPATAPITCRDGKVLDDLYTDGGVRDNYSLSVAVKLSQCDRVMGMYLGQVCPTRQPWNGLLELAYRTLDETSQTIYEADQDDGTIRTTDIRSLLPHFTGTIGRFDVTCMPEIREAGFSVTEHFLHAIRETTGEVSWDAIFRTTRLKPGPDGATLAGARSRASRLGVTDEEQQAPPEVKYYIYRDKPCPPTS